MSYKIQSKTTKPWNSIHSDTNMVGKANNMSRKNIWLYAKTIVRSALFFYTEKDVIFWRLFGAINTTLEGWNCVGGGTQGKENADLEQFVTSYYKLTQSLIVWNLKI